VNLGCLSLHVTYIFSGAPLSEQPHNAARLLHTLM